VDSLWGGRGKGQGHYASRGKLTVCHQCQCTEQLEALST